MGLFRHAYGVGGQSGSIRFTKELTLLIVRNILEDKAAAFVLRVLERSGGETWGFRWVETVLC
jgi:hypothetical protein